MGKFLQPVAFFRREPSARRVSRLCVLLRVFSQRVEHPSLMAFFQRILNRFLELPRLIHEHEVPRWSALALQQHRNVAREEEDQRQEKEADPTTYEVGPGEAFQLHRGL